MRLLLDTHTAIWFVTDNKELPKSTKQLIEDPENFCFYQCSNTLGNGHL